MIMPLFHQWKYLTRQVILQLSHIGMTTYFSPLIEYVVSSSNELRRVKASRSISAFIVRFLFSDCLPNPKLPPLPPNQSFLLVYFSPPFIVLHFMYPLMKALPHGPFIVFYPLSIFLLKCTYLKSKSKNERNMQYFVCFGLGYFIQDDCFCFYPFFPL